MRDYKPRYLVYLVLIARENRWVINLVLKTMLCLPCYSFTPQFQSTELIDKDWNN